MAKRDWASIGLALAEEDSYAPWFSEILTHAGLTCQAVGDAVLSNPNDFDVIVLGGRSTLNRARQNAMLRWVSNGGRLVVCGSTWGLDELLGVNEVPGPNYSRSYLTPPAKPDRLWPESVGKTVFMGGARVELSDAEVVVETSSGEPAVTRKGRCIFIAPHVAQTLATMYLGRSVETDAIGPGDDSVDLEDGVLRAEDGTVLSYTDDRETLSGCKAPLFARAHADAVRQILVRAVFEALELSGKQVFATWHWPDNADAVASVSIDCEQAGAEEIVSMYRTLANYGMPATWMIPVPGMPNDVYRLFRKWGHTPGLLYRPENKHDPLDQITLHHKQISRGAGSTGVTCVKIENGQWFGLTDVYHNSERAGARLSVSKGGVQPGSTGFLYGSSHIHYPIALNGRQYKVAELPYLAYKPGLVTESAAVQLLTEEVARHYGCMHINLALTDSKEQELALQDALMIFRQSKMKMFSPAQLGRYEQARRRVSIRAGFEKVSFISDNDFEGFTFMVLGGEHDAIVNGRKYSPHAVKRYGTIFTAFVMNLDQKEQLDLGLSSHLHAA